MSFLNVYKRFRKAVLISLVFVEAILSVFIYLESTAYFGVYDIIEISITFALIFYVFMLSNDLEDYEDKEIREEYLSKISPSILIHISREGEFNILSGSLSSLNMPNDMNTASFRALFSNKEWEKIEGIANKVAFKKQKISGTISFIDNTNHTKYLHYIAQIAKRHKFEGLLVWMFDTSETKAQELYLTQLFHKYRIMSYELDLLINSLPIPVWRRELNGRIVFCNQAYKDLLQKIGSRETQENINELDNFFQESLTNNIDTQVSIKKVLTIENQPVILKINEIRGIGGGSIGYCTYINEIDHLEKKVSTYENILENILKIDRNAVLIVNNLGNISFFNQSFIDLFNFEANSISNNFSFSSLIDKMREKEMLPEVKNYKEFKWQQMKYLTELSETEFFFMHLPDGKSIRVSVIPVQGGDTIFHYENIQEQLSIERACNEQVSVLRSIIASFDSAVAIIGQNGKLQLCNNKFIELFNLSESPEQDHFIDVLSSHRKAFSKEKNYLSYKTSLISAIDQRKTTFITLELAPKQEVELRIEPLPDNTVMAKYNLL